MSRHVPISDFKDHASELVAAAEGGEEIVITRHGKPAARLTPLPVSDAERRRKVEAALERAGALRERLRAQGRTITMDEIIAWKNEGRR